jgi:myo-inositol 2-dehydrogenase/D-chiro-inositol 1-dehydrogenase
MCGFSRRFDESYRDAYKKVQRGLIGRPSILRSQTCDKHDPSGFFVEYATWSGGVFVDMTVHDIDLTLWFFEDDIIPKSISAHGITAVQPELKNTMTTTMPWEFYSFKMERSHTTIARG